MSVEHTHPSICVFTLSIARDIILGEILKRFNNFNRPIFDRITHIDIIMKILVM